MNFSEKKKLLKDEMQKNSGVLRLVPSWVARTILMPGKRIKLDSRDIFAKGPHRGHVCERWMASTGMADNGELTAENEGMSFVLLADGKERILLKEAIDILGDEIIGNDQMEKYGGLKSFAKFYDFSCPIPHHVHLMERESRAVGVTPKPEAYYFPRQMNFIDYNSAHTFFGLLPGTTKEDIKKCLVKWAQEGDNGILEYSAAYKLKLGTGWDVPAGILHAPGSLVTYEPQQVSDTSLFFQSMVHDKYTDKDMLTKFVPDDKKTDFDYLVDSLDWEANTDTEFKKHHYHEPIPVDHEEMMIEKGYTEFWVVYGSADFSAKELTVLPGKTVFIKDAGSYGLIMMEGHGSINGVKIETPVIIRHDQITSDEMYVTRQAAANGITVTNPSDSCNLVMLKHFGPDNKDADRFLVSKKS